MNIPDSKILSLWPNWIKNCTNICKKQYGFTSSFRIFHEKLVDDIYEK